MATKLFALFVLALCALFAVAVLSVGIATADDSLTPFPEYTDVAYDPPMIGNYQRVVFQYKGFLTVRDNDKTLTIEVCRWNAYDSTIAKLCKSFKGNFSIMVDGNWTYSVAGLNRGWLNYWDVPTYGAPIVGWYATFVPLIVR